MHPLLYASVWFPVCTAVCAVTLCREGDLSSVPVDLEQGNVVFVGDLADQAVAQTSIGGLWVVPIRGKNLGKWDTWME